MGDSIAHEHDDRQTDDDEPASTREMHTDESKCADAAPTVAGGRGQAARPPLIIHFHIPKNGGVTISRLFKMKLGFWPPSHLLHHSTVLGFYSIHLSERIPKIQSLSERAKRRIRFVEGHAGFGLHEFLPQPSTYITMLRDPIDRAVSSYFYQRQEGHIPQDVSFEQWIARDDPTRIWFSDNPQVRYLAGEKGRIVDVPHGTCTEAMLELAKQRLHDHFALVGILEQFDASMILLRRLMGWRSCYYGRSNVTRQRKRVSEVPDATLGLIREHNELDLELYRFAKTRFQERIDAEGPSFQAELRQFQVRMEDVGGRLSRLYRILGIGRPLRRRLARTTEQIRHPKRRLDEFDEPQP